MLNLFCASGSLFHTAVGIAYADFTIDGHRETWAIRSRQFRTWLRRCYFEETGCAANSAVLSSALDLLEAKAQFDAPSEQSTCASLSTKARSTWISPIKHGSRLG